MLRSEFEVEQAEAAKTIAQDQTRAGVLAGDRVQMARQRQSDAGAAGQRHQGTSEEITMTATAQETDPATSDADAKPADLWTLRLYVAGQTPKSLAAFANLKRICEEHLKGRYRIEVIDLLETPQLATDDQILAIPTLVRKLPEPVRKIIGDLSNTERVLVGLDLLPLTIRRSPWHKKKSGKAARRTKRSPAKPAETAVRPALVRDRHDAALPPRHRQHQKICEEHLQGRYDLEVIDLYQQPQLAQGRADHRRADADQEAAAAVAPHHRRHVEERAGAGRAGPAGELMTGSAAN